MEICELHDRKFEISIIKTLNEIMRKMHEQSENLKRRELKKKRNRNLGAKEFN